MTRKPDPDARCTAAREALTRLPGALERTWELRYDQGWQPEAETPKKPTPTWRPYWLTPTPIQRSYLEATQHLARAHQLLYRDTFAETHTPLWHPPRLLAQPPHLARTTPLGEAHLACHLLTEAIAHLHGEYRAGDLAPPETGALLGACDETQAALDSLPDGLRQPPKGCKWHGCGYPPEPGRGTCRRHRADRRTAA